MKELKPAREFSEQLSILENRNMVVDDHDAAMKALKSMNYYRLTGYSYQFITHLNYIGAQKFSTAAAKLFKRIVLEGENVDLSQYFYPTFDDMMAHNADIFNAWLEITDGVATALFRTP